LEVPYFHYNAALATTVSLNQTSMVDLSATIGTPTFVIGAEAGYEPNSGRLTKGDNGDTIKASYIHHLDESKKSVVVAEITRRFSMNENTFTVRGSYVVDSLTVVKSKLNNHGKLGALLRHKIIPNRAKKIIGRLDPPIRLTFNIRHMEKHMIVATFPTVGIHAPSAAILLIVNAGRLTPDVTA
nr:mitochondrial outer membrane protein porin 2-like [Tanacetum cinerariifolium]